MTCIDDTPRPAQLRSLETPAPSRDIEIRAESHGHISIRCCP